MNTIVRLSKPLALLAVLLLLAGCAGNSTTSTPAQSAPTTVPTPAPTAVPTEAVAPTPLPTAAATNTPEVADACLIGRWIVADLSPYFQTALEGTDITFVGSSGNAWYQFNRDGSVFLEAIQFTQSTTIKTDTLDVPVDIIMDGPGFASYRVEEAGKIIFSDQQSSSLVFEVEVFGERTDLDTLGLLGDPALSESVFLYECQGSNRLLLTPPLKNYEVFPIILERYP